MNINNTCKVRCRLKALKHSLDVFKGCMLGNAAEVPKGQIRSAILEVTWIPLCKALQSYVKVQTGILCKTQSTCIIANLK